MLLILVDLLFCGLIIYLIKICWLDLITVFQLLWIINASRFLFGAIPFAWHNICNMFRYSSILMFNEDPKIFRVVESPDDDLLFYVTILIYCMVSLVQLWNWQSWDSTYIIAFRIGLSLHDTWEQENDGRNLEILTKWVLLFFRISNMASQYDS